MYEPAMPFVGSEARKLVRDGRDPKEVRSVYEAGCERFPTFTIAGLPKWWPELSKKRVNGVSSESMARMLAIEQRSAR